MTVILLSCPKSAPILAEQNKRLLKHIYLPDYVYSLNTAHKPPTQRSFRQLDSPTDRYHLMNNEANKSFTNSLMAVLHSYSGPKEKFVTA